MYKWVDQYVKKKVRKGRARSCRERLGVQPWHKKTELMEAQIGEDDLTKCHQKSHSPHRLVFQLEILWKSIDSQRMSTTWKRCPHKVPTLEEINLQFAGLYFLSNKMWKLDTNTAQWEATTNKVQNIFCQYYGKCCPSRYCKTYFSPELMKCWRISITDGVWIHGKD